MQFYRLWKSISGENDQSESVDSSIDSDTKYGNSFSYTIIIIINKSVIEILLPRLTQQT